MMLYLGEENGEIELIIFRQSDMVCELQLTYSKKN